MNVIYKRPNSLNIFHFTQNVQLSTSCICAFMQKSMPLADSFADHPLYFMILCIFLNMLYFLLLFLYFNLYTLM